ncbi:Zinc finger CCCH domain-containing protein 4 [Durusdinium trenchii]|uniref:Zinc finger CCCH domain-containing protein 4 n=1 Tax=Durusdinium trenchii TaxID=1381693 RepID=A0ABP0S573_9DINO
MPYERRWSRRSSSRTSSRSSSRSSRRRRSRSRRRDRSRSRRPFRPFRSRERSPRSPRSERSDRSARERKSRICIHWERGHCGKGENCNFAHGAYELSSVQGGTWKTVLCKHFENGTCSRGSLCSFAHGEEELRDTFKTVRCKYYERGECRSGSKCKFAHGSKELVKMEIPKIEVKVEKVDKEQREREKQEAREAEKARREKEKEEERARKAAELKKTNFKTVLCKYFEQGNCTKGDQCSFAHGEAELPGGVGHGSAASAVKEPVPTFKTVLCKYFELGHCSRGEDCTYAHGLEDLQTREVGTYKTVLCKYFEAGTCTKGASCTFAHGDADLQMDAVSPAAAATAPCAVAATAFGGTSLADAIAQSTAVPSSDQDRDSSGKPVGVLVQPTRLLSKRQLETAPEGKLHPKVAELMVPTELAVVKRCAFFTIGDDCTYSHDPEAPPFLPAAPSRAARPTRPTRPAGPAGGAPVAVRTPKPAPKLVPPPVRPKPVEAPVPVEEEELEVSGMEWEPGWDATMAWKTRLCKFFELGTCQKVRSIEPPRRHAPFSVIPPGDPGLPEVVPLQRTWGDACSFAHGPAELQGPPSVSISAGGTIWADMVKAPWCTLWGMEWELSDSDWLTQTRPAMWVRDDLAGSGLQDGSACLFAHGEEELREPWLDLAVRCFAWCDNRKTVLCKFYDQGTCQHGDQCLYAHGVEELQALFAPNARKHRSRTLDQPELAEKHPGSFAWHQGPMEHGVHSGDAQGSFKTALCKFFEIGQCLKGEACTFAHGPDELANSPDQGKAAPKAAVVVPPPSRAKALEEATEPLEEANADVAEAKKGGLFAELSLFVLRSCASTKTLAAVAYNCPTLASTPSRAFFYGFFFLTMVLSDRSRGEPLLEVSLTKNCAVTKAFNGFCNVLVEHYAVVHLREGGQKW